MHNRLPRLGIRGRVWACCLSISALAAAGILLLPDIAAASAAVILACAAAVAIGAWRRRLQDDIEYHREQNVTLLTSHAQLSSELATNIERAFTAEVDRARRHIRPLSVLVVCTDPVSPSRRRPGRDVVWDLRELIRPGLRTSDTIARLRDTIFPTIRRAEDPSADAKLPLDDSLLLLLPETNRRGAEAAAEKLRRLTADRSGYAIRTGIAVFPHDGKTPLELVEEAQRMLWPDGGPRRDDDAAEPGRHRTSSRRPAGPPSVLRLLKWATGF